MISVNITADQVVITIDKTDESLREAPAVVDRELKNLRRQRGDDEQNRIKGLPR